jgi:hypothetical protein
MIQSIREISQTVLDDSFDDIISNFHSIEFFYVLDKKTHHNLLQSYLVLHPSVDHLLCVRDFVFIFKVFSSSKNSPIRCISAANVVCGRIKVFAPQTVLLILFLS